MDFETMDWDAEAKCVARAFGVIGECEFRLSSLSEMVLHPMDGRYVEENMLPVSGEYAMYVAYDANSRWYCLRHLETNEAAAIHVFWDSVSFADTDEGLVTYNLARALFYLDLLTLEVEADLDVTITAHQKLEWKLEYEARYESWDDGLGT